MVPKDRILISMHVPKEGTTMIEVHKTEIMRTTGTDALTLKETDGAMITVDGASYIVKIEKK